MAVLRRIKELEERLSAAEDENKVLVSI